MRGPARLLAVLAFAAATHAETAVAAATARFVPADPQFVVANVRQSLPDEPLRALVAAWRAAPAAEAALGELAGAFLARAHTLREPMYVGRAEALLAPVVSRPGASARLRRLYAETLQYRHDFAAAETLLDAVLREFPRDAAARVLRASVRLVRGDFGGARGDCAQLAAGNSSTTIGIACLAAALAGSGELERASALLQTFSARVADGDGAAQAYLLTVRAELRERSADRDGAIADYSAALSLAPRDDSIRAALADALAARGDWQRALTLLDIERPSLALLVRHAALARGAERGALRARALAWLDLEGARGDARHYREAAMLALDAGQAAPALLAAQANFQVQRELADVRVLARAAVAARDSAARTALLEWLRSTGYRDAVADDILSNASSG